MIRSIAVIRFRDVDEIELRGAGLFHVESVRYVVDGQVRSLPTGAYPHFKIRPLWLLPVVHLIGHLELWGMLPVSSAVSSLLRRFGRFVCIGYWQRTGCSNHRGEHVLQGEWADPPLPLWRALFSRSAWRAAFARAREYRLRLRELERQQASVHPGRRRQEVPS